MRGKWSENNCRWLKTISRHTFSTWAVSLSPRESKLWHLKSTNERTERWWSLRTSKGQLDVRLDRCEGVKVWPLALLETLSKERRKKMTHFTTAPKEKKQLQESKLLRRVDLQTAAESKPVVQTGISSRLMWPAVGNGCMAWRVSETTYMLSLNASINE